MGEKLWSLYKVADVREDIISKSTFSFGHCPNQLTQTEKNTIDYDNGFNDNYISNDGNFDDNDDKKHTNIISFE